jgi:N-acetylglucosamine-6-sulfatase
MRIPANPTSIRVLATCVPNQATSTRPTKIEPGLRRRRVSVVGVALVIASSIIGLDVQGPARSAEASASSSARPSVVARPARRPNVVLILTDDQRADTLHVMPAVRQLIAGKGVTFTDALVTNPLCCPSRATILTGQFSHSTRVYGNYEPHGGWPTFKRSGAERRTIARALDLAGYRTGLFGKYLNHYSEAPAAYVPPGWDRWFVFSQVNGSFYNYRTFDNVHGTRLHGSTPADYSTDVIRSKAVKFIRTTPRGTPFFLMLTPYAPHEPSTAAPRHEGRFAGAAVDLGPAFTEDVSDKPGYIRSEPEAVVSKMIERTRDQWESLLAVDEMVRRIFNVLAETGRVRNTLFIFTSDHGISNGQHHWRHKIAPYEEAIRIPLLIRYQAGGVVAGGISNALAANVDLASTIADFAGVAMPFAEGRSLRGVLTGRSRDVRGALLLEHATAEGTTVPGYCGIRTHRFMYARYADGFEELYDLISDPNESENLASAPDLQPTRSELEARVKILCSPRPPGFAFA